MSDTWGILQNGSAAVSIPVLGGGNDDPQWLGYVGRIKHSGSGTGSLCMAYFA
ncbi:MAG: hypothetical protein JMN27_08280 [gamma proteobacterium endosymbiont of Lamellibrachia anaximandri]|nr:hypothetical protein [gamma proteobacterium endosymbiont of Lamellibrachia anaximandri]